MGTGSMDSYLKMMKNINKLYRKYEEQMVKITPDASDFSTFIENLNEPQFHGMMAGIPALFGAIDDSLFKHTFSIENLKKLTESDNRWDKVLKTTRNMPLSMDLTDSEQERQAFDISELLLDLYPSEEELRRVNSRIVIEHRKYPVILHLATKLALSKKSLESISSPIFNSFIVAMYNEHNRIRTNMEHPSGEDFLRRKVSQLNWLFEGEIDKKWELIFVDDGCPEKSGEIAAEIIQQEKYNNVRVLFLVDGIEEGTPVTKKMQSTADSQKEVLFNLGCGRQFKNITAMTVTLFFLPILTCQQTLLRPVYCCASLKTEIGCVPLVLVILPVAYTVPQKAQWV